MDDENNANPPPPGNGNGYQPPSYRIRRSSSSIISSTTSPMFQAPANPNLQPPPSPLVAGAHHSRQRQNIINNNNNNHFGPGDIDDDVQPSNSRATRASASSNSSASSSSYNNNNNRPQSPLGSPDSTYWGSGPSPSPAVSYRAPLTPGGMCVVSSSTSDDIQSPFSPEDIGGGGNGHHNNNSVPPPPPVPRNVPQLNSNNNNNGGNLPQVGNLQARLERALTPSVVQSSSSGLSASAISKRNRHHHLNLSSHQQNVNQDLNISAAASSSSASTSSSSSSSSFNISPLRNKIKKASSFERFSLAQAAINSNAASSSSSSSVTNEQSISSLPPPPPTTVGNVSMSTNSTATSSASVASRLIWDPSPPPNTQSATPEPTPSTSSSSAASLRSFSGTTEKFHIKIPSKKLAAKIASVFEQEQLNESIAAAAAAASGNTNNNSSSSSSSSGIISSAAGASSQNQGLIVSHQSQHNHQPPSTLAQILNQSPSNINVNSIMNEEIVMNSSSSVNHENLIRELSDAPLNLTESSNNNTATNSHSQQPQLMPPRNPVISSRSSLTLQSKKIPLTPKQKLLHRMQSAEFLSSMSPPPPPPPLTQQIPHHQHQQQSNAIPIITLHQSLPIMQDVLQNCNNSNNHLVNQNGPHSPQQQQQQSEAYGYESLLRSRDDFGVQDSLQKVVVEDPNSESPMLYDPDAYSYYYQNILNEEIFSGGNQSSTSSARPLLMMPQGNLQDTVDQPHGHLEFVLGLNAADDHENERGREDDLQLNNEGNPGSQHQFLDPNDALSAMKSQSQTDSTLRNLLMMDPIRNSHPDDAWLAIAAEYQNRINTEVTGRSGRSNSQNLINVPSASSSMLNVPNNIGNSWTTNEWPRTASWQPHHSGVIQDQEEVMDMSMMEQDKGSMSNQNKRLQIQLQQSNNEHGMDEVDLTNGLPMLSSMQMSMPMDLQQPMSMIQHGSSKESLPMDLQQHHRMDIDDEPVNLISVNMEQELAHHHNSHHSHQVHQQQQQQLDEERMKGQIQNQSHHQQQGSYTLQIQSQHSPPEMQQPSMADINNGNSNSSSDNIDERKLIRVRRNKDNMNLITALDDGLQHSPNGQHTNVIMDKPIQPKSFASLPSPFNLLRVSGNGWAVFTTGSSTIASNTRLGPVEGPLKKAYVEDIQNMNAVYPCLVMADASHTMWQLDRTDDELCNWMKYVRLAHSIKDQNALIVESNGYLYFVTCKEIAPKTELQVGFSLDYAQKYGFPYLLPMGELVEQDRMSRINNNSINSPPPSPEIRHEVQDEVDIEDELPINNVIREPKSAIIEKFSCFECDQEFLSVEDLQTHLDKSHQEIEEEIRKPKKKVIKKLQTNLVSGGENGSTTNFDSSKNEAKDHSNQNQLMSADSSMGTVEPSSSVGGNESCSDVESSYSGKAQDNRVSTGVGQLLPPAKVKCSMCYKSFATKERLERHMIVHSPEDTKPLQCQFCTKRFLTNSALAGHIKTHAEEGKCFECPMCDFSTQQLLQLKEHVQSHKNRDSQTFHCPQCSKRFVAYSMIRKHIRAFHGPRQFKCDHLLSTGQPPRYCPMSFPTSDKLKLHKLKHSDYREYLCSICGSQFKRKDKLREHTKRIHETKKRNIEINLAKDKNVKKFIPKVSPEEYEKFLYKCQDCMLGFKRRGMLVNHLAKRHPDKQMHHVPELNMPILRATKNYYCLYCERVYKSSSKRKAHSIKAHPGKPIPPNMRGKDTAPSETVPAEVPVATPTQIHGTIVQTVTDDEVPRDGIMNVSCTSNIKSSSGNSIGVPVVISSSGINLVSTTSASSSSSSTRKETVVGKVVATPHSCPWCHRQYATRAKLLQHQRKSHFNLMTPSLQTPRTQKNNVAKASKSETSHSGEAVASTVDLHSIMTTEVSSNLIHCTEDPLLIPDSSTSSGTSTTIQTVAADGLPVSVVNEGMIGFVLTTSGNGPPEIVMVPVQNLSNASSGGGSINVNVIQTSQSLAISNASSNIMIASSTSNNCNGNSNNNVISNISNSGVNVHPILTQME